MLDQKEDGHSLWHAQGRMVVTLVLTNYQVQMPWVWHVC